MAEFNVGFIGLGIMGESMCANIIKNGYPTWVYNIAPEQVQKMVNLGANACESFRRNDPKCFAYYYNGPGK